MSAKQEIPIYYTSETNYSNTKLTILSQNKIFLQHNMALNLLTAINRHLSVNLLGNVDVLH
jgi:hypothetical protein